MTCNPDAATRYLQKKKGKEAADATPAADLKQEGVAKAAVKEATPAADLKKEGVAKTAVKEATTKAGKKKAGLAKKE